MSSCCWRPGRPRPAGWTGPRWGGGWARTVDAGNASFVARTFFDRARFHGSTGFRGATFSGVAEFGSSVFFDTAGFWSAAFNGEVFFAKTIFMGPVWFSSARFAANTRFTASTFGRMPGFDGVTLPQHRFSFPSPGEPWVDFSGAHLPDDHPLPPELHPFLDQEAAQPPP